MSIRFLAPFCAAYDTARIEASNQGIMQTFHASGAMAIRSSDGVPVRVVDLGAGQIPRYVWREVQVVGSPQRNALRWNAGTNSWDAESVGNSVAAGAPPFLILTRTADHAELEAALSFFLADRTADMTGQPFAVPDNSGVNRYQDLIEGREDAHNEITRVWLDGDPAPFWWSLIPSDSVDEPDQWWITYWTANAVVAPVPPVRVAYHATAEAAPADFIDWYQAREVRINAPLPAGGSPNQYISVWTPRHTTLGGANIRLVDTSPPAGAPPLIRFGTARVVEVQGVPGNVYRSNDLIDASIVDGVIYTAIIRFIEQLYVASTARVDHDQPHPHIVRNVILIDGQFYDASREQLAGDRPDPRDRTAFNSPWARIDLNYTPSLPTGQTVELPSSSAMSDDGVMFRVAPPPAAMRVGWWHLDAGHPDPGNVDFDGFTASHTLSGFIAATNEDRATLVIWVALSALEGHRCIDVQVPALSESFSAVCSSDDTRGPDGVIGAVFFGLVPTRTAGFSFQVINVTPVDE